MAGDDKFRIWDAYWQDRRLYSAGVDSDPVIAQTLEQHWALLARALPEGSRVLDIACGNGCVGLSMLRSVEAGGGALAITGIDSAAIDPPRFVPEQADVLQRMTFRPHTSMEKLPFENESFDVAVSQFGVEYGTVRDALTEAARILRPHGLFTALALPARGPAVRAANISLKQCRQILRGGELFECAITVANALNEAESKDRAGDSGEILQLFNVEAERTVRKFGNDDCDVVFAIILGLQRVFVERKATPLDQQIAAIQTLRTRLAEYAARAQALIRAALSDQALDEMKRNIVAAGFKLTETKQIMVGAHGTVAWQVSGERLVRH